MGSWGLDPFDNDDASDWAWSLEDGGGPEVVREALAAAAAPSADEETDAPAVAAAALVAAALGVTVELPDTMVDWLAAQDPTRLHELAGAAVAALDRVLSESELADLWDEQGPEWRAQTRALREDLVDAAG